MLSRNKERLLRRLKSGRMRSRESLFVVEGIRGAEEALESGAEIRFALCSPRLRETERGVALARRLESGVSEVIWVDDPVLAGESHTDTPQGVLLVCEEGTRDLESLGAGASAPLRLLVLDGIQDPGNVGTLIRTAAAFGLSGVLVLPGTADPWSAKSVRASAGGCFRVPVVRGPQGAVLEWLARGSIPVWIADASGQNVDDFVAGPEWALVVGSEGAGASAEVTAQASARVAIPMPGGTESLNAAVAGGILLHALTRRSPSLEN